MKPFPIALRRQVLDACDAGGTSTQVARQFGVSSAWVRRLKQRRRELGVIGPLQQKRYGSGRRLDQKGLEELAELVSTNPYATLEELRQSLSIKISRGCLCDTLKRMGLGSPELRADPPFWVRWKWLTDERDPFKVMWKPPDWPSCVQRRSIPGPVDRKWEVTAGKQHSAEESGGAVDGFSRAGV